MTWIAATLWDLIWPSTERDRPGGASAPTPRRPGGGRGPAVTARTSMQQRYDALVIEMKALHGVRVRRWRNSTTGCAWQVLYQNGSVSRLIESPYPRGPVSCAVFLHEIGHHAIGFGTYRTRCLEEYHAWKWALDTMRQRRLNVTPSVERRVAESLAYAIEKARRRGLRRLPAELAPYDRLAPPLEAATTRPGS